MTCETGNPECNRNANPKGRCMYSCDEETRHEILKPESSHGAVINKAAKHLPDGYILHLMIEKSGYGIELESPDGRKTSIDCDGGIIGELNEAIAIANGFYT